MARVLDEDELIGNWTLVGDELEQLSGRRGATKLGFALLLRFYAVHGRFPAGRSEIPDQAVAHVARLVDVLAAELGFYEWDGRTIKAHRADIRGYFGFRECSVADADKAAEWLAANVCEKERQVNQVREELLAHLKGERIEPPAWDRVRRIIGTALRQAEQALTASRVPAEAAARMLALIKRYKADVPGRVKCYAPGEHVPVEGIIPAELAELMYQGGGRRRRILRTVYECGVFQALREKLRCKEIWVAGAEKWRNPDLDLPADFEARRAENYAQLRKPLDPRRFTGELREELDAELSALNDALGGKGVAWLKIAERRNAGAIHLTPLDAAPEPRNLRRLKTAIRARWGVVPLMDMLTETCLRTGCLSVFTPAGTQNHLDPHVLFERLLLLVYAYGTGTGIRAAAAGDHPHTEDDLRYARRRYLTVDACRQAARIIANATFASRQAALRGEGTTAVASDSTHFSAFDQNIFTEWHSRYRRAKRGVLIYWTVDVAGSMAVHSQLISCSASEVHAMVEGAMRHGTDMEVEQNFVDSHGASFVGFGITRLLDFDLIARFKQISTMKLYVPGRGDQYAYPALAPALTRPVGRHREQLRPDDEVRHRDPAAHRLHRGAAAPLHLRDHPPGLRCDARDRARPALHLPGPLAP